MTNELFRLRQEKQAKDAELKAISGEIQDLEYKVLNVLEAAEMTRFDGDYCTVIKTDHLSVSMPKDENNRKAFFDYLKEKNIFDSLITVNSQTLNAWYRQEDEAGNYSIPGLGEPKSYSKLSVRKK